jgi:hypothetical protein
MDPRTFGNPTGDYLQKQEKLSPLMKAKQKSAVGIKVNACPFGCENDDLDDNGYCRHLVGFTVPGDKNTMYPRKPIMVQTSIAVINGKRVSKSAEDSEYIGVRNKPEPVLKTDRLVLITVCHRVYRDVDAVKTAKAG